MGKKKTMRFTIRKQKKGSAPPKPVAAPPRCVKRVHHITDISPLRASFTIAYDADGAPARYFYYTELCNIVWDEVAGAITWQVDNEHQSVVYEMPMPPPGILDVVRETPLWRNRIQ